MALKILLADDSMTAQKLGMKILVDAGYQVVAVSNGAAAVKKIASEKPDLAVLDIYMPGYTGLEVCERVRAAAETAKIPVLLTVGKMEMGTFKPEDANRVKADGVIIKPFEASDLLAAVKKIEEKLAAAPAAEAAAAAAEREITEKINVAELLKKDSSYQEWQVTADEHKDEEPAESGPVKTKTEVPQDVAGDAAMADMFGEDEEPVEARAAALEAAAAPEPPAPYATAPSVAVEPVAPPIPLESAPNTQKYEAPAAAPQRDPELEPTSAKHHVEITHAPDPHFEPTVSQDRIEVEHVKDPALVTDAAEMATAFVTKFGVDNPEPVSVGVAADANIPGLYTDGAHAEAEAAEAAEAERAAEEPTQDVSSEAEKLVAEAVASMDKQPAPAAPAPAAEDEFEQRVAAKMGTYEAPAEAPPEVQAPPEPAVTAEITAIPPAPAVEAAPSAAGGWAAQESSVAAHEANASLDQEMLKAFSAALPAATPETAAPAPEPVAAAPAPVAAPPAPVNAPDIDLARAMAAAVAPDAPPMVEAATAAAQSAGAADVDPAKLADAIHRALDRLKPELIANIAKELEKK